MDLLSLYLADFNSLTRRERWCLTGYAGLIFAPLLVTILTWWFLGPALEQILAAP